MGTVMTNPKVAIVTGASRGAGKGIALGLAEKGMTVYVTGRTKIVGKAKGWDGTDLPGTVEQTAMECNDVGGKGIAIPLPPTSLHSIAVCSTVPGKSVPSHPFAFPTIFVLPVT